MRRNRRLAVMCSTPFGINGRNPPPAVADYAVATRAQRLSASTEGTTTCRGGTAINCAQRLSASTEGTHVVERLQRLRGSSAQRLSASTEGTLAATQIDRSKAVACSTPFGINGRNTGRVARSPHATDRCAQRLSASTEGTRAVLRLAKRTGRVLNAFRHQRKEH